MSEPASWLRQAHRLLLCLEMLALPLMTGVIYIGRWMTQRLQASLETELPALTRWFLAVPPWMFLIVFVLVLAGVIAKERWMEFGVRSLAIDFLVSAAICVFAVLVILAIFLPLVAAIEGLSTLNP